MFIKKEYKNPLTTSAKYPVFSLTKDSWNDYSTYSLFDLSFHESDEKTHNIGRIKILQKDSSSTLIPNEFFKLDDNYISEPYRVCRSPTFLRECSDEKSKIYL